MKNKDLEKLFMQYINTIAVLGINAQMSEDENAWILFGEEDFHLNKKNNTLYVKPFNHLMENIFPPHELENIVLDWVAFQENPETKESWLIVGPGNPFENEKLATIKNGISIVRAVPAKVAQRMQGTSLYN